jgi:hypothetical protein
MEFVVLFFELLFLLNKDFHLELQISIGTVPAAVWNRKEDHGGRRNRISDLRQHEFISKHTLHRLWRTRDQEGGWTWSWKSSILSILLFIGAEGLRGRSSGGFGLAMGSVL